MKKQIEFKNGTIKYFQEYVADKIKERGFEDETVQERLLLLAEEVGELIHGCRKITGMNIDKNREIMSNVGEEIADVINMVFAVGIKIGLDIEKEFLTKEQKVDKRFYERFKEKL